MLLGLVACTAGDGHSSRSSLDWTGTYSGVLPCADCPGIETTITLGEDERFRRAVLYLDRDDRPRVDEGSFEWDDRGAVVTLQTPDGEGQSYHVGENVLFHLDRSGNRITGDLEAHYRLEKHIADPRVEGRRWILTEIVGKPVEPGDGGKQPFLFLDHEEARASGNASCNNFFGGYALKAGSRIRFDRNMASTMMACADMSTEQALLDVFAKADNYSVADGNLTLNRARMAPLARFRLDSED